MNTKLTDEQIDFIAEELDEAIAGTDLEKIAQMPSNQGVETVENNNESGSSQMVNVQVNPQTGEHSILGEAKLDNDESLEELFERFNSDDFESKEFAPINQDELSNYIHNNKDNTFINHHLSDDSIRKILEIVNAKIKKKNIDIYKEFPDEIKKMIDGYLASCKIAPFTVEGRRFRNIICENLIDEFITNINIDRSLNDFNKEIETLFSKASSEIAEMAVGYTTEKNAKLRKYAETMEDEEKKAKLNLILDKFDDAYLLTSLKEFAKKCKIKKYDLERPDKIYKSFLNKYSESKYNIYDINIVRPILARYLNTETEQFTERDINAFLICFCKQCVNMKPNVPTDHAYMYNVIFNITLSDINKGEKKEVSDQFVQNIREVIYNLRERNNII